MLTKLNDLSSRSKALLFAVLSVVLVSFVIFLAVNDRRVEAPAPKPAERNAVKVQENDISANGPDAVDLDASDGVDDDTVNTEPEPLETVIEPTEEDLASQDRDVETPTDLSAEEQDALMGAAADGILAYYTTYSTEDLSAWNSRVGAYFVPGSPPLSNPPMGERDFGDTQFDSEAVLNFVNPIGPTATGFQVLVGVVIDSQFKDLEGAQAYRSEEFIVVDLIKVDSTWKIAEFNEDQE